MFYVNENALNMCVRPGGCMQSILVHNTECKHDFVYEKTTQDTFDFFLLT